MNQPNGFIPSPRTMRLCAFDARGDGVQGFRHR
jgi:hypothetical protein